MAIRRGEGSGQSKCHSRNYGLSYIDAHDERDEAADAEARAPLTRTTPPVFQWVMMAAYSIIILSSLTLMGVILWRGLWGERTRN